MSYTMGVQSYNNFLETEIKRLRKELKELRDESITIKE